MSLTEYELELQVGAQVRPVDRNRKAPKYSLGVVTKAQPNDLGGLDVVDVQLEDGTIIKDSPWQDWVWIDKPEKPRVEQPVDEELVPVEARMQATAEMESPPRAKKQRRQREGKDINGAERRTSMTRNWHRHTAPTLNKRSEILVWGLMFSYAKVTDKTATVRMSVRKIAQLLGWKRHATVQEAINGLVEVGLLQVLERGHINPSGDVGIPSLYRLRVYKTAVTL